MGGNAVAWLPPTCILPHKGHRRQVKPHIPCGRLDARVHGHDHRGVIPAKAGIQQVVVERYIGS